MRVRQLWWESGGLWSLQTKARPTLVDRCSSMQQIRDAAAKVDKEREVALESLPKLRTKLNSVVSYVLVGECIDKVFEGLGERSNDEGKMRVVELVRSMAGLTHNVTADVSGAATLPSGRIEVVSSESHQINVLKSKIANAELTASRNLRDEWAKSMAAPLKDIEDRFSHLTTGGRPVVVRERVPCSNVNALYDELRKIDPDYSSDCTNKEDLRRVPKLVKFFEDHAVSTPYSLDLIKCCNRNCCCELTTPLQYRDLALHRQPTPILDKSRKEHFFSRDDAIDRFAGNRAALTDLSDLPSHKS